MKISKGIKVKPLNVIVYGPDGVGKSTLGATAPNPIFVGPEKGSDHLDVERFDDQESYKNVLESLNYLLTEKHDYKTLVLDSLDHVEPLLWAYTAQKNGWADIEAPGFGKGYTAALGVWSSLIKLLEKIRETRNMHIILIAHSMIKTFNDPTQALPYDRYQLKLNDKAAALWRESVDAVFFVNYELFVKKNDKNDKKGKALDSGLDKRLIFTTRMPSYDAKNRFSLPSEIEMASPPNGFNELYSLICKPPAGRSAEELFSLINAEIEKLKDPALKLKITEKLVEAKTQDLNAYLTRVSELVNQGM